MMKTEGKRHLTIRATAEALEVPEGLVRRMVRAGEVDGYRVGKWFYIDVPVFREKLEQLRVTQ